MIQSGKNTGHSALSVVVLSVLLALIAAACEPAAVQLIPTQRPTTTATYTPSPTRTPETEFTPRPIITREPEISGGPTRTPLFGATATPLPPDAPTATRAFNPNAPSIEFFTSNPLSVQPGGTVTLFWSARRVDSAVIYRLNRDGERTQVYNNVAPDGSLEVSTDRSERDSVSFVLSVGQGDDRIEETLVVPLRCPVEWFFSPSPDDCAATNPLETLIKDQSFERGRMLYVEELNTIYVLFNDGQQPAWSEFESEYDPAIHAERDPNAPPEFIQPLRELGLLWRSNEVVRTRLGLGTSEALTFDGFYQTAPAAQNTEIIYISGADGNVLQLMPGAEIWQIISP